MPTKTDEKIAQLTQTVNKLKVRLTQLVDELATTRNELNKFKNDVASDVKYLTNRVDG
jgi:DNA-binding Xre family transcriptional regulator